MQKRRLIELVGEGRAWRGSNPAFIYSTGLDKGARYRGAVSQGYVVLSWANNTSAMLRPSKGWVDSRRGYFLTHLLNLQKILSYIVLAQQGSSIVLKWKIGFSLELHAAKNSHYQRKRLVPYKKVNGRTCLSSTLPPLLGEIDICAR